MWAVLMNGNVAHTKHKPATSPSARYMCMMDVAHEPKAKPTRPVTEPVMQTVRDPYRVTATPMKMDANQQQQLFTTI